MKRGKLVIIMGPTGSGKGTLERYALSLHPELVIPVTATTRAPRPGEIDTKDYYFFSHEEFDKKMSEGFFLETATYGQNKYGTPKHEVVPCLEEGKLVLLEIEVQGVRQLQKLIPKDDLLIVYIEAGSWEDMEQRVRSRAPITEEELAKRRHRYEDEVTFKPEADVMIDNRDGHLETAKKEFADLIESILKTSYIS
ncbi:MAG: guanylate kinase [Parcubacteria group bacterium]|nr:guanylate kinase [Parcubacteria group bacterium]